MEMCSLCSLWYIWILSAYLILFMSVCEAFSFADVSATTVLFLSHFCRFFFIVDGMIIVLLCVDTIFFTLWNIAIFRCEPWMFHSYELR
jgi:hypothetical protein